MPSWSENSSTGAHTDVRIYKCRERLTTQKHKASNHINKIDKGIITGKLTEVVRGGCCCEAVVAVLLDESAVEAAVDAMSIKTCIPCGISPGLGIGIPEGGPMRNCGILPIGGNPNGAYATKIKNHILLTCILTLNSFQYTQHK